MPAHLLHTLVLKALHIFVCIENKSNNPNIPNMAENNILGDYTKMMFESNVIIVPYTTEVSQVNWCQSDSDGYQGRFCVRNFITQ